MTLTINDEAVKRLVRMGLSADVEANGYHLKAIRPTGKGYIVLAAKAGDFGQWATWFVGPVGPVEGHYFDSEADARHDFERR